MSLMLQLPKRRLIWAILPLVVAGADQANDRDKPGIEPSIEVRLRPLVAEWKLGEVSVVLDHTPMGDFVEVEGPPQQLDQTAHKIGLDVSGAVRGSYVSLWQEYRSTHPEFDLPVDMVFGE